MNNRNQEYHSYPIRSYVLKSVEISPLFNYSNPTKARELAFRLNQSSVFSSAEISAIGLLGQAARQLILHYQRAQNPALLQDLYSFTKDQLAPDQFKSLLEKMLSSFPPHSFYLDPALARAFLFEDPDYKTYQFELLLSLFLVGLADENPAFSPDTTIFRDLELVRSAEFNKFFSGVPTFFDTEPRLSVTNQSLLDMLRAPWKSSPDSLAGQLDYVRKNWFEFIDDDLKRSLVTTMDVVQEEQRSRLQGPGPVQIPEFSSSSYQLSEERENFSDDLDWMPRTVLLAKNVFVWLDQLSKKYMSSITTLDQIPQSELALLASRGITALWLIGLWERSNASQRIKQLCGNQDAIPSAYSLYDYQIADALGGDAAYQKLHGLSKSFGIRLAADMVPNHVGLSSKWVYEHPDWFISLDRSPFPGYTFQGENLSENPDFTIQIEDHYYDKSDAAVVFKHHSHRSAKTRYIYHGNDGTSMPWNDTAQLNYLRSDVREAVIQTILHVARKFSIIRFDAAMTLTKKHFQRLWFPEPGSGGAIPSRSEHGLDKSIFDKAMPVEFWREVVDRVAEEAPDTLLLAEAFWMMEGFFVRTLGMHRVYNSAFMHMLRDEKNQEYRLLLKKTLEYDPQILKRYVNFMNNPDEETAVAQFGSDGKYFGVCTLMSTLPGLPMFGHGQIEGFSEKYGMEYHRAYYDEFPDQNLIDRHNREIFPLLKKRYLFAEVDHFYLYDFVTSDGSVSEDVICYSNQFEGEKSLVIYHNKWGDTAGSVTNTSRIDSSSKRLSDALNITPQPGAYLLYREHISGLEYLIPTEIFDREGFSFNLGAYDYRVLWEFKVVQDLDGTYDFLYSFIGKSGVQSLEAERQKVKYHESSAVLLNLFSSTIFNSSKLEILDLDRAEELCQIYNHFLEAVARANLRNLSSSTVTSKSKTAVENLIGIRSFLYFIAQSEKVNALLSENSTATALIWPLIKPVRNMISMNEISSLLPSSLPETINPLLPPELAAEKASIQALRSLVRSLFVLPAEIQAESLLDLIIKAIRSDSGKTYLKIHSYQGVDYFHKESFSDLAGLLTLLKLYDVYSESVKSAPQNKVHNSKIIEDARILVKLADTTNYRLNNFLNAADNQLGVSHQ